jgi:beta-lactamase class D
VTVRRLGVAITLAALAALTPLAPVAQKGLSAETAPHECAVLQALDGSASFVSDAAECALKAAPASTFKVPHALIALETGVVTDPLARVAWDGTKQGSPLWERAHSLDSAMKWSALWFYQRTATLIGRERMLASLKRLGYGSDTYEGERTSFWLNGDLVVSPMEQLDFMSRLMRNELSVKRQHVDVVKAALRMPPGEITNASGTHPFALDWPPPLVIRAKTGNTTINGERVSWVVGHLESRGRAYVFVARVRGREVTSNQAGAELARQTLNARPPK